MQKQIQLFPPELRTASIVPRWSVVWTLTRDTIANHSYYVTLYARAVAHVIKWSGNWSALMFLALTHDLEETITGDLVSPVKREIIDPVRAGDYIDLKMKERMPAVFDEIITISEGLDNNLAKRSMLDEAWTIIDVADRLDALLFLIGEQRMGNGVIAPRIPDAQNRLYSAWMKLPLAADELQRLWQTVMLPVVRAHEDQGGIGV